MCYSQKQYRLDLAELEKEFENDKKELLRTLDHSKKAINNVFLQSGNYQEGKSFNEFVKAMTEKVRIVIILEDQTIIVLNDSSIPDGFRMSYSRGMLGFKMSENSMRWWEYTPAAYQENYEFCYNGDEFFVRIHKGQRARWFITNDTAILQNEPFYIQKIEYPVENSNNK